MPRISRLLILTALGWLAVGMGLLALVPLRPALGLPGWTVGLRPVGIHLITVGWITQLIFGVAYWMFPRRRGRRRGGSDGGEAGSAPLGDRLAGSRALPWAGWGALNGGLVLRTAAEPAGLTSAASAWDLALVASGGLQWVGILAFVLLLWPRASAR